MILIEDTDVPLDYAILTWREFHAGIGESLFHAARGDALVEWYERGGGPMLGRVWLWKDGQMPNLVPVSFNEDTLRVLVLWYAKPERMH